MFRPWAKEMPDGVEICAVQLPGKGLRRNEPPIASIPRLARLIALHLLDMPKRPFAFFGHSMGAALASEVAQVLLQHRLPLPSRLIVSGRRPPSREAAGAPIGHLPDGAFVEEINKRYGGIHPEILANADVLALLLPGLRSDIAALESFRPAPREPFSFPIAAFGGDCDPMVPASHLAEWRSETTGEFETRLFPGDHFYLDAGREAVTAKIARLLSLEIPAEA